MNWLICSLLLLSAPVVRWEVDDEYEGWYDERLVLEYHHHSELQRQWAWELLGQHPLRGDETVLDFGSGDGKITAELDKCLPNGRIVGADISPQMLDFARKSFPHIPFAHSRNPNFSGVDFGFKFDRIVSFCALHRVPDLRMVLINLRLLIREDGQLLAVIPLGGNPALFEGANLAFEEFGLELPVAPAGEDCSLRTTIESAYWEIESLDEVNTPYIFVTRDQLHHWLIGTMAANLGVPFDLAPRFFDRVIDHMEFADPSLVDDAGSYHLRLSRLHLVARPIQ